MKHMKRKTVKRFIALCAAALTVCMVMTSCSSNRREETGVANEKNMSITKAADLEGKAVGVQLRSAVDEYVTANSLTAFPKRYEDLGNAAQDLADKKLAAIVTDANYAKKLVADVEGLKVVKGSIGSIDYRFITNKSDEGFAEKLSGKFYTSEEESYADFIQQTLTECQDYTAAKGNEKFDETYTFVAEPYFKPFAYESDGKLTGFFKAEADIVAYRNKAKLDIKTVAENAVLTTVQETSYAFGVVHEEYDDENFITTDVFYTSELVMVVRADEKKK